MKPWTLTITCPICEEELTLDVAVESNAAFVVEAWDTGKSTCTCDIEDVEVLPEFVNRVWSAIEDHDTDDADRAMDARIDAMRDR